ncbi:MAG: helix-turn-helix domain-containing protein [Actinomycetota bacterium]
MADELRRRPAKPVGRKRDEDLTASILKAAGDQLLEVGFDRLTTQDVATRAGAGKGAIYRRWATKEALLADAIRAMPARSDEVTDDPIADLRAIVRDRCESAERQPDLVPGLITAMRADAGIDEAVKAGLDLAYVRDAIARVVGAGHPHLELLTELTQAIPLFRATFAPDTLHAAAMTEEIMAHIEAAAD